MRKSKLVCGLLVVAMTLCLAACGKTEAGNSGNSGNQGGSSSQASNDANGQEGSTQGSQGNASGVTAQDSMTPGKLYFMNLEDRDPSILRGVRICGNQVGSTEFNSKEKGSDGIRCVFQLNEWVEFYPDTDAKYGLRVWILTHREDQSSYETTQFSDLMPGFVNYCDLHYPEDEENPEEYQWGSFYLNPADCQPGYYDFVYVYEGKAIAKMLTYFYADGEIQEKSDEELEKLMKGLSAK
ncbi:MAG: hypothetical protein IKO03_05035 [Lachnospiraceae bacterium]|nr:hypothetical protein [Lachnospiraceae bacterium]